jgi:5-methylcytosine-specific restriction endonuclease McrA
MARCARTTNLEVHHIRRDGGSGLSNAKVLCQKCHAATSTYGTPGKSPEPFSEETKKLALQYAGNQCECRSLSGCH